MPPAKSRGDPGTLRARLGDRDLRLLQQLARAGLIDPAVVGAGCEDEIASALLLTLRSRPSEPLFFVFSRIYSEALRDRVWDWIRFEALPLSADEIVAEALARFYGTLSLGDVDPVPRLLQSAREVLDEACSDLRAYVPGAGLEPLWSSGPARSVSARLGEVFLDEDHGAELSPAEFELLVAHSLLGLSRHDRRLLLGDGNAPEASSVVADLLSRSAAQQRLEDSLYRCVRWLAVQRSSCTVNGHVPGRHTP